jgi:predicted RNA binding protein YcfA (HicA-like mRNA interferase family)
MQKLPLLSGREVVKVFQNLGWQVARQKGNQIILVKERYIATLSDPDHRELPRVTLSTLNNLHQHNS